MDENRNKDFGFFLLKLVAIWLSWKVFIWLVGEERIPVSERKIPALSSVWESMNDFLREILLTVSRSILHMLGYSTEYTGNYILKVEGYGGVALGNYCLGFQLMYYFTMLVIISSIPSGKKIAAIIIGILMTQALNVLRIVGLNLIDVHVPELMFVSHDYLFNIVVMGTLLLYYYKLQKKGIADSNPGL